MTLAGSRQSPAFILYHLLWNALDWVFPPHCGGCNRLAERWCASCQAQARPFGQVCACCGIPLETGGLCPECKDSQPIYAGLRSFTRYAGPARNAVIRLKYSRDIGLGEALATNMAQQLAGLNWPIDIITCVPLSGGRLRQRGYNQAAMLARPLSYSSGKSFRPILLRKTREAPSQVGLSASERRKNVWGAFEASGTIAAKNVLVVDDVTTTGSTINACARALLDAGATAVYGLTFARAGLHDHNIVPSS
jgi:competence protein ComFC